MQREPVKRVREVTFTPAELAAFKKLGRSMISGFAAEKVDALAVRTIPPQRRRKRVVY